MHLSLWQMNVCIYTLSNIDLTFKTRSFIQECTTMTFLKLFTELKYCAAHVQSKTDRGLTKVESKEDMPSYCSHPWVLLQGQLLKTHVCMWIYMELQWPLVAENKTTFKRDGREFLLCHQHSLSTKKGTERHRVLEQPANMWQSHPGSCEIFPLLTSSWLIAFWASFLKLFSLKLPCISGTAWMCRELSQTWGMTQLLAASFWKAAAPQQMNRSWAKAMWTKEISGEDWVTLLFYLLIYPKLLYEAHIKLIFQT